MERPSVLLVEDRPSVLRLLSTILEDGYQVTCTVDGAEALAALGAGDFDVVVTDVRIPTGSGFEVLREARRRSPRTQVVMMTAYANVRDAVAAIRSGAYDYVAKPLDADEVKLVVARATALARGDTPPEATQDDAAGSACSAGEDLHELSVGFHRAIELARDRASRAYLVGLLRRCDGNVTRAACQAGMTRESLHRVMRKYGVRSGHAEGLAAAAAAPADEGGTRTAAG
jgi:DNA-binding NtrC family response regulator